MSSTTCYRYITIPFVVEFTRPKFTNVLHVQYAWNDSTHELNRWLEQYGAAIGYSEAFYKPPGYDYPNALHLDGHNFDNHVKLNFVENPGSSKMVWWNLKPGAKCQSSSTVVGTGYLWAHKHDCELIDSSPLSSPTLVNAGMLHSVEDVDSDRLCYSFMLVYRGTQRKILWSEAVHMFAPVLQDD